MGEELLKPTRIYAKDSLALVAETKVRTRCHVTGGGLAGNRLGQPPGSPSRKSARDLDSRPVFGLIAAGAGEPDEMYKTFNMGVGMVAIVAPEDTDRALAILTARYLNLLGAGRGGQGSDDWPRMCDAPHWSASIRASDAKTAGWARSA